MPKPKLASTRPKKHEVHHSGHAHSHQHSSPMEKVTIKRVKRNKKKPTTKEKLLAGLGVGGSLLGGMAAMAPKASNTEFVRADSQGQTKKSSAIKNSLSKIFGIPKAQASDEEVENPDIVDGDTSGNTVDDSEVENQETNDSSSTDTTGDSEVENSETDDTSSQDMEVENTNDTETSSLGAQTSNLGAASSDGPTFTTKTLANATVGQAYSGSIRATGSGVVTYMLNGGALPPGLAMSGQGNITGTPTGGGTFVFNVEATDGSGLGNIGQFVLTVGNGSSSGGSSASGSGASGGGASVQSYNPVQSNNPVYSQPAAAQNFNGLQMSTDNNSSNGLQAPTGSSSVLGQQSSATYTVKKGDTLWGISKKYYGDGTQWRKILSANPSSLSIAGNVRTLKIGFVMNIPAASATTAQTQSLPAQTQNLSSASSSTYTVKKGDTLSAIAQKYYGDSSKSAAILAANSDKVSSPRTLQIGTVLNLPALSSLATSSIPAQTQNYQPPVNSTPVINNYQTAPAYQAPAATSQAPTVIHLSSFSQTLGDEEVEVQE